ncbi:hypothetical protein INT45_011037, partial [Circinella minor]
MPFSLYGDLPEPSKEKESGNSNSKNKSSFSGLYSSLPAPGSGEESSKIGGPSKTQASSNDNGTSSPGQSSTSKPAGWSAYGHFRPVMRKPTIQAKPKLNRPVIPAGATIVSTTTVNKESSVEEASLPPPPPPPPVISKDKRTATITSLPRPANINIPYFSANDDINGFKTSLQNKKKGKNKGKQQQQQQQAQPIAFDMNEDYDPHRPNDYEQYKEERKQMKEEIRRQKREQRRRRRSRSRSISPYYSSDDDRRSRSGSPRNRGRAFAPPANLYDSSERNRSPSPPSPPSHRGRSPSPSHHFTPPKSGIDLNETADEAYMRRVRMSSQRSAPVAAPPSHPTPMDEDDQDVERPMLGLGAGPQDMAKKVMSKYGWQEGQGLGRGEDGIKEALHVQPTGRGSGVISSQSFVPAQQQQQQPQIVESRVVLLTNMVGPGEVDDMLQEETAEECAKYGQVERCLIFEVPNGQVPDDQAVRIFVKFTTVDAARSALNDLNGRYFGGRVVTAKFFDRTRFDKLDLAPGSDE